MQSVANEKHFVTKFVTWWKVLRVCPSGRFVEFKLLVREWWVEKIEGSKASSSKRTVELYLQVENVNSYHDKLLTKAVNITNPLTDQWWGDRTFTVIDPYGYQIWFYQTVGEITPPAGAKII